MRVLVTGATGGVDFELRWQNGLAGAVPAAIMALIADEVLEWIERKLSPA